MFKYSLKRLADNQILASLKSNEDIENPWESKFEKFDVYGFMHNAREAILDSNGKEILPAREKNYEVIKEDISYEYELAQCLKSRRKEYPSLEEVLHAMLDGGDLSEIQARRASVKAKYPKPEEE